MAQSQYNYSNREYYEMIRCYILSGESLRAAQRMYENESLPRFKRQGIYSQVPNCRTIYAVNQRLLDFGQFKTPSHATGQGGHAFKKHAASEFVEVQQDKDGSDLSASESELLDNKVEADTEAPRDVFSDDDNAFLDKKPVEMDSDWLFYPIITNIKTEKQEGANTDLNSHSEVVSSDDDLPLVELSLSKKLTVKREPMNVDKEDKKPKKRPAKVMLDSGSDDDSIFDSKKTKSKKKPANSNKKANSISAMA